MNRLSLLAPLDGWVMPLAQVCDEVFAGGLSGDGVAIDPVGNTLFAPCDGEIVRVGAARHALILRHTPGVDLLLHVGIDTVALHGEGFELLVADGQRVRAGDALLRFDLDRIARDAKSAVTPVLVASGGRILRRVSEQAVKVGEFLLEIETTAEVARAAVATTEQARRYRVPFDHGLHARPAAQLVAALRGLSSEVTVQARGRSANAHSAVALMALGVQCGDEVEVVVRGSDADAGWTALGTLLAPYEPAAVAVPAAVRTAGPLPSELKAVVAARGLALGRAASLHEPDLVVAETGQGSAFEAQALRGARAAVGEHLRAQAEVGDSAQRELLLAHVELLHDPELTRLAQTHLERGASAGFAWRAAVRATADAFGAAGDARMRERAADLRDLELQVLCALAGVPSSRHVLPEEAIVLSDELLPSQLVALDLTRVKGIVMARGGPTSHVALLAAARGIPTLVAAGDAVLDVPEGRWLLLDAERGRLALDPSESEKTALREQLEQRAARDAADLNAAQEPASTRDGTGVAVLANIGAVAEAHPAVTRGAEGCGLLRTEFLFLERHAAPDAEEQARVYAAVLAEFAPRPVTIRTLDVGGDKPLAYLPLPREENPQLGVRGLRIGLREPGLLRAQFEALLRASNRGHLRILLPMVNELSELRAARALLANVACELGIATVPPLGVMIETPAAALLADQFAREADFLSIGSNDLSQYVLAMDRGHAELGARLDGLHPAVLRLIAAVADAGRRGDCPVSLCGGLGSDPVALPLLLGLGLREVSVVPTTIPRIKRGVRDLDLASCQALARRALDCASADEVRALVADAGKIAPATRLHAAGGQG